MLATILVAANMCLQGGERIDISRYVDPTASLLELKVTKGENEIMIKDIVANLSVGVSRDVATDFAVSVAATLDSHLTGIAFRYEPLVPLTDRYGFPAEVMESQRAENEKRAKAAMAAFDEAARRAAVSAQSRALDVPVASAPTFSPRSRGGSIWRLWASRSLTRPRSSGSSSRRRYSTRVGPCSSFRIFNEGV